MGAHPACTSNSCCRFRREIADGLVDFARHTHDMTKAAELASALDVPVANLFTEDDDLAAAILAFAKLPADERQRMREELERLAGQQPG